jgi:type I restriction enzyme S subunit
MKTGYKHTEAGLIPEDWGVKSLSDIATVVRGGSPRPAGDPRYFNGDFIPWLTVAALTNISDSTLCVTETVGCLTEEGSRHSRTLEKETLIISNSGATLGVAKILGIRCCANDGIAALINQRAGNKRFICYYLNTRTKYLRDVVATGNGQPNLNTELIRKISIPFPTPDEQQAIAEALSDVDELIGALDGLIAKKRDLKQAAMQQLLTGRQRLPGFGRANAGFKQTEVGEIPNDWEVDTFGELFSVSGGFSASRDQLSTEGHCYLHYGDIHKSAKGFVDVGAEYPDIPKLNIPLTWVSSKSLLATGDVVFVDASEDDEGASKHIVVINDEEFPYISGLHTIVAKSKATSLDNTYKRYCFQTRDIKRQFYYYAVGTKVTGISKTNIKKIFIPRPPLPEQRAIAAVLSDMDAEIAVLEQRRDKTRALKQAMMQELLTGKTRLI